MSDSGAQALLDEVQALGLAGPLHTDIVDVGQDLVDLAARSGYQARFVR